MYFENTIGLKRLHYNRYVIILNLNIYIKFLFNYITFYIYYKTVH